MKNNAKGTTTAKAASQPVIKESFLSFLKDKDQKIRLAFFALFYLVVYFALTYLYPFPDGISDSGGYVLSAVNNQYYGYRPFGYSKFLIMLHNFAASTSFVVFVQYWLSALVTLFFVFSVRFFLKPASKVLSIAFDALAICSISTLYLTNTILSDSLFASLTLLWITLCFWIAASQKQFIKLLLIAAQFLILYILMTVRYTGLLYIGIEILFIAVLFFRQKLMIALACAAFLSLITMKFYNDQVHENEAISGVKVFSGFTGWQKANNALHVIPYIDVDLSKIENADLREFIKLAKDSAASLKFEGYKTTPVYLWHNDKPLKEYLFIYANKTQNSYLPAWIQLGKETYSDFGSYIMFHYPIAYFQHYLLPNFVGTLYCTTDQLYAKEFRKDAIPADLLAKWYNVDAAKDVYARSSFIHTVSSFLPIWKLAVWLLMLVSILFFVIKKQARVLSQLQRNIYWTLVFFVLTYFAFHVYAAPFELRYVVPIYIMQLAIIYFSVYAAVLTRKSTIQNKE